VLAVLEARRLLLHPVMLAGFGVSLVMVVVALIQGMYVVQAFDAVTTSLSFFPGVPAILAGHMVATRDRRAESLDMLAPAPARAEERVRALCLAALAPALVGLVYNLAVFSYLDASGQFVVVPNVWHLLQPAVTILGGALLGIMLGVWSPARGTPVIALVAMVAASLWIDGQGQTASLFGPMTSWTDWGPYDGSIWYRLKPGSPAGHVFYLCGLCGLAVSVAVLRVAERRRFVMALALAAAVLAVVGGLVQLP
jgi:hypothetical protein